MQSNQSNQSGSQGQSTGNTGTQDVTYDLISIIFHALQGAETYQKYAQDAARGNPEIQQFIQRTKQQAQQTADEAKRLLAQQLQQDQGSSGGGSSQGQ